MFGRLLHSVATGLLNCCNVSPSAGQASASWESDLNFCKVEVLGHQCPGLPDYQIGLRTRARKAEEMLQKNAVLGIIGMGGIGKTTLAKKIYNKMSETFEYTCFLENVKGSVNLEDSVQRHFYRRGKGVPRIRWEDVMKKQILIVMDDVDSHDQLHVLPKLDYFGGGSKIIITSRDSRVLSFFNKCIRYDVEFLEFDEAKELFCSHAFDREDIPDSSTEANQLEGNVTKVVQKCGGLPLTLEVMGRYLRDHTTEANIWEQTINKLGKAEAIDGSRDDRLCASLQVSYDALQDGEQEMFRTAATTFFHERLDEALAAWSTAIGDPESRWATLISRSMVKVIFDSSYPFAGQFVKYVWVHEQLRDLGKNLAKDEILTGGSEDGQANKIVTMLNSNEGNENTSSVALAYPWPTPLQLESVARLKNLKYLTLDTVQCQGLGENLLRKLSGLRWNGHFFPSTKLLHPISADSMNNLAVLRISRCGVDEGFSKALGNLTNLRILDLESLYGLDSLPEIIGNLSQLKQLSLSLQSIRRLPESLGKLSALEQLTLKLPGCSEFPESIGNLSSLVYLDIANCIKLVSLPASSGPGLKSLKHLRICSCLVLESLPHSFFQLPGLQEMRIEKCDRLKELGDSFENMSALRHLILEKCKSVETLPENLHLLTSLEELTIECHNLARLPRGILELPRLKNLILAIDSVKALPDSLGQRFSVLDTLKIKAENLESLPNNIGQLSSLRTLDIHCARLEELPESLGDLCSLETLKITANNLQSLPSSIGQLSSVLESLEIKVANLESLPNNIGQLSSLRTLDIYCDRLEKLPESLGDLCSLEDLTIWSGRLKKLPENLGRLQSMQKFSLRAESLMTLPGSVRQLSSLQEFKLQGHNLERLPDRLDYLPGSSLALTLSGSETRQILPKGLGNLSTLGDLTLNSFGFKTLPEEIGKLASLRRLKVFACDELESLPDALGCLSSLREMELWLCDKLNTIPNSLGRPLSSQVALPHEEGRIERIVEKPPSQPSATKGLRLGISHCTYLSDDSLMRSLGWVIEEKTSWPRVDGRVYRRENANSHAC